MSVPQAASCDDTLDKVLGISGFTWADLHQPAPLARLHELFLDELAVRAPALAERFRAYRASQGRGLSPENVSDILVETAPLVAAFVARLFGVESARQAGLDAATHLAPLFRMKDQLVKRRAWKRGDLAFSASVDDQARLLLARGFAVSTPDDERAVARAACELLDLEAELKKKEPRPGCAEALRLALGGLFGDLYDAKLVAACLTTLETWLMMRRQELSRAGWLAFRQPQTVTYDNLVPLRRSATDPNACVGPEEHRRHRDGFGLTDRRMSPAEVADQVDYCLYCHGRDKDSCSKGLVDKDGSTKANPLGIPLPGCPLDEKISEAHLVEKGGDALGALALICIDNPMLPGTGHRICNDCMKACVFQKQDPVNIPQIESGILTDVLALPWGVEIYALLTRWNPLHVRRPFPLPYHGKNVLVVGLGPAGYTLCHHLINEGFGVVAIDGLKLEPLPEELLTRPIKDYERLTCELDERILLGFGGVSEYGITVRWDKNFLTLLYLALARRDRLRCYGGVRFGGTITLEDAWSYGFDHVAIAAGAGKPTVIELENNLLRGIRKASDFLMGLQLTGAYKRSTLANLQVRLPAVVIGGGLTAIDTATELRAYYVVQVEKLLARYEALCHEQGEAELRRVFDAEETALCDEFLAHGRQVRDERVKAARLHREPDFDALLESWGGVTIAYRKKLVDSPAYRLNHEEVIKCLEEGVHFLENASPKAALPDEHGALRALTFVRPDKTVDEIPARTLCVAAGTSPNTIYEKEHPGTFALDKKGFFRAHRAQVDPDGRVSLEAGEGFFTSYLDAAGHTVSYYGDNHPTYAGSVVKAMASAKDGFVHVAALFAREIAAADPKGQAARDQAWQALSRRLDEELLCKVVEVKRLTPTIVEVVVSAPQQARTFHPGQFYRLQNYETQAPLVDGTRLLMEGMALTGAWVDKEAGLLSLIVLEMGGSSRLCAALRPGEPVVVMGPTGAPTEIPRGETVLLCGGGLGNAVLFSIAKALRDHGNRVVYFAGYKKPGDVFKQHEIEEGTDQVVWASDVGPAIVPRRPEDRGFVGNIVQAIVAYAKGELGAPTLPLGTVDRIIAIGSDRMMAAVAAARHGVLAPYLKAGHKGIGSINSPMQCMMKEVCAQCLQKHVDPETGRETEIVFTCFNQDQPLDAVDWKNLSARLRQNTLQEKLTDRWLNHLLARKPDLLRV
jgi:NADPH-dependent glutamate synthase beta subunit-like oxidoreductase/NAD(P)H-flavin reductase